MINEKEQALFRAKQAGVIRDLAISKGGTGHLRPELTTEEQASRKAKRNQAKASRKHNRKGA